MMRIQRVLSLVMTLVLLVVLLASCSVRSGKSGTEVPSNSDGASSESPDTVRIEEFNPSNFGADSSTIDNKWWPLTPGTQFVYEGTSVVDGEELDHRIVFMVTDLTKEIAGVKTQVVFDRDYVDDELSEAELAFFAQDQNGNVWLFGEYVEAFEGAELVGGKLWLEGHTEGAHAGIIMQADPKPNSADYSEGYAPEPIYWSDRGRVDAMGVETNVAAGSYTDVLVVEEYNDEEPGASQLKYYAPGVGNVRIGWRGEDAQQEEMELTEINYLESDDLDQIREQALELENRAYAYGETPPATRQESVSQ